MRVKLTLLDRQQSLSYSTTVEVYQYIDSYERIGTCKVTMDEKGNHFGELQLDREVSGDMFFYYRGMANNEGVFEFVGLDLMQQEQEHSRTTRLKDMIID